MANKKNLITPDYIFETSWEVCNRVGGIYTVLSSRAKTMQDAHPDKVIFVGPDFWKKHESPFFREDTQVLQAWKKAAHRANLPVRVGRWTIPGEPIAVLIDFRKYQRHEILNEAYANAWSRYLVDSLHGYGDYEESAAFGIAAGIVMESLYKFFCKKEPDARFIAHFNEWMTAFGLFHIKENAPDIATVFTTHATSIGRSIAGNGKPLYDQMRNYNGDQMARELNMEAKHSVEKAAAWNADCFTTVSDITDIECAQLLDKKADVVTPNGFEDGFVPSSETAFRNKRDEARKTLIALTQHLTGTTIQDNAFLVGTCGRAEYKNKGIDLFIDSLHELSSRHLDRDIIGFIMVPGYISGPRKDLQKAMKKGRVGNSLPENFITHDLVNPDNDNIVNAIRWFQFPNRQDDRVKLIYIPSYLNGDDGIVNKDYYDLLIGLDLTVFPSYYEPWGYTPLESVAFSIPTITTTLSGFGQWVLKVSKDKESGCVVENRGDYDYLDVRDNIAGCIYRYSLKSTAEMNTLRAAAKRLSKKALWEKFIVFYEETYNFALAKKITDNKSK